MNIKGGNKILAYMRVQTQTSEDAPTKANTSTLAKPCCSRARKEQRGQGYKNENDKTNKS